jgi:Holliday junction resolvase
VSGYSDGRKLEYAAADLLWADGYWVMRSAGSKGTADIVAIKLGEILFVQCKLSGTLTPGERHALVALAAERGGTALCARWVKVGRAARTVEFRELTGPGPKDWRPWTADHALEEIPS